MSVTIQEVSLKDVSITVSDDFLKGRITLEGDKGEVILLACSIDDLTGMTAALSKVLLAELVRRGNAAEAADSLLHRRTATIEDHVPSRIQVVREGATHALILNTIADTQLRILLMPAQRDAVLQLLGD
jgi:hypothetical protein